MILDDYNYGYNPLDYTMPDATFITTNQLDGVDKNGGILLRKGLWKFVISNPSGTIDNYKAIEDYAVFVDDDGNICHKKYMIESVSIDVPNNKLNVFVRIYENPIPAVVIYGAIWATVIIIGAISANSVLESVEEVIGSVASPNIILLVVIIGAIIALPYIFKRKK